MLATATDAGSLAATPITRVSGWPALLIRHRVVADVGGTPGLTGGAVTADSVSIE